MQCIRPGASDHCRSASLPAFYYRTEKHYSIEQEYVLWNAVSVPLLQFARYCSIVQTWSLKISGRQRQRIVSTLPLEMHYVGANLGENWVKIGDTLIGYWPPNERVLSNQVPDVCAKFHQNRLKIATVRARTDTQTEMTGVILYLIIRIHFVMSSKSVVVCSKAWRPLTIAHRELNRF